MKTTTVFSLSLALIASVIAAPPKNPEPAYVLNHDDAYFLTVQSLRGRIFRNRPVVALGAGTIGNADDQIHLPPSFGLENFTVHPASQPVTFSLQPVDVASEVYTLYSTDPTTKAHTLITQYILPEEDNLTAIGWDASSPPSPPSSPDPAPLFPPSLPALPVPVDPASSSAPASSPASPPQQPPPPPPPTLCTTSPATELRCDTTHFTISNATSALGLWGREGGWEAAKTAEGEGWRVVWREEGEAAGGIPVVVRVVRVWVVGAVVGV